MHDVEKTSQWRCLGKRVDLGASAGAQRAKLPPTTTASHIALVHVLAVPDVLTVLRQTAERGKMRDQAAEEMFPKPENTRLSAEDSAAPGELTSKLPRMNRERTCATLPKSQQAQLRHT